MRIGPAVLGAILLAVGGVWIFQGIGTLKGSFMTGSPFWFWVGVACAVAGAGLVIVAVINGRG